MGFDYFLSFSLEYTDEHFVEAIPEVITDGLTIATYLPAIGFAMLAQMIMNKNSSVLSWDLFYQHILKFQL